MTATLNAALVRATGAEAERDELRGLLERATELLRKNHGCATVHEDGTCVGCEVGDFLERRAFAARGERGPCCIHGHDPQDCEFGPCAAIPEGTPTDRK